MYRKQNEYTELPRRWKKVLEKGTVVVGKLCEKEMEGGGEVEMAEMNFVPG